MFSRSFGSALLIIGTTIGAGMLSLPLVVASCGFIVAIILLVMSWSVMYITAIRLLNICAKYPLGVNFTTMMQSKAPKVYQISFSVIYLLLLYSLMSAYTTQGAELVNYAYIAIAPTKNNVFLPALIFILIFSSFMYSYRISDYTNRFFVFLKFIFFILAIAIMLLYINPVYLKSMPLSLLAIVFAWPTLLPSFGFHNVIPVLYEYQQADIKSIRKSIFVGSISVLVIYIVWLLLALALIPQQSLHSYQTLFSSGNNTPSGFIEEIKTISNSNLLELGLNIFIHIAIITSFIGVGISLIHYMKDLFIKNGKNINNLVLNLICFVPPLIFTVFYPKGFILALQYAAIFAVIIFVYTPIFLSRSIDSKMMSLNFYAIVLGSAVIICQIVNLYFDINPF
ncbi:amino acid permease [Allofrancisella inopinata]|uniref:Amino acid transporter n=1 Tax=Allofrancisella inopinata TaxID=1085647 RepID=A0AAE7CQ10_9GAMM|nr:aromatic amino acid transport family protein [Allofrancisella inopinata]QIV95356.1 amino acid transporter [Allofrancisella inopinata]TDT70428.1 amino acid permease [Allofrancisella inopinata]